MEKLKNIINPGSKKDDEVMYGSGHSDDPVHSGSTLTDAQSGRGNHLGSSRTTGNDPLSPSSNPTSANSAIGSSGTSGLGSNARDEPHTTSTNPIGGRQQDTSGTSGLGSSSHKDPLTTSTNPTGGTQYDTADSTGRGTHGLSEPYASRMPGAFEDDAATTASVRSGVPGHTTQTGSGMTGTNDPDLTKKSLPHEPATAGSGLTGYRSDATRGNSLSGGSYPDRSVGDSASGDQSTRSSHLGRDVALGAGAVRSGTAARHPHESTQPDNYAPESGRTFPLRGSSSTGAEFDYPSGQTQTYGTNGQSTSDSHSSNLANKADPRIDSDLDGSRTAGNAGYGTGIDANPHPGNQGSLSHDATLGAGTGAATGFAGLGHGPESWVHDHNRHGHQYEGDPCGPGETTAAGPHFVHGPHATDTANRLDPYVEGGTGSAESATGHKGHQGHAHQKEDAGLEGGATGTGVGAYEGNSRRLGNTTGTITGTESGPSGIIAGAKHDNGPASNTAGPHKSDILNKLDPRVDSDLSKQQGGTETDIGSSTTKTSDAYPAESSGRGHHHDGAEVAAGGAGLAGSAAYEDRKHHHGNEPAANASSMGSSHPHSGSGVDDRLDSGSSGFGNIADTPAGTGKDHHLGRDAAFGAGAGGLAYETERHHGKPTESPNMTSNTIGDTYDNTRGPTEYDQSGSHLAGSSQQPLNGQGSHHGRDAGLGAGARAYENEKHHHNSHTGLGLTPQDQLAEPSHRAGRDQRLGRDAAVGGAALGAGAAGMGETHPSSGYGNDRGLEHDPDMQGRRKEETLAGGAAAGGLAHHEHSKHDEKALEKEHSKEIKQHDKALAKEEKAIEKEEKHHEKERAKHLAAIEKDQKKHDHDAKKHEHDAKKHEYDAKKHEHDGEKKHGGLLGFLHKDKHDKNVDHSQASGQVARDGRGVDDETSTGSGAGSYDEQAPYGSQAGVHDSSVGGTGLPTIGSGITTHDAYGTQEGHNKLHKDPPAKVLEARGQDYQGHGNVK